MKFKDILPKVTGFSCPIGGLSWEVSKSEKEIAKKVIIFLEQKRVLYNNYELEIPSHCIQSVIEIREFLTEQLMVTKKESNIYEYVSAMRTSCNRFLNSLQIREKRYHDIDYNGISGWSFAVELGELRGLFGVMIMQISLAYQIDVERDLATIMPLNER